jgi:hypothetical protein
MKIARMFTAAALVAASLGVSGAASAQDYRGDRHAYEDQRGGYQDRRDDSDQYSRRDDRQDHRNYERQDEHGYPRWDTRNEDRSDGYRYRGNGWNGARGRGDGRCHTEWRYHHRVTRCW